LWPLDAFSRLLVGPKCMCGWGCAPNPAEGAYSTPPLTPRLPSWWGGGSLSPLQEQRAPFPRTLPRSHPLAWNFGPSGLRSPHQKTWVPWAIKIAVKGSASLKSLKNTALCRHTALKLPSPKMSAVCLFIVLMTWIWLRGVVIVEWKPDKGRYSSSWGEPHLRATGRHLPCGITQCYLPPDTSERAPPNPSHAGWYSIFLPRRDGRLSWPSWLDSAPAGSWTSDLSTTSPMTNHCTTKTSPHLTIRSILHIIHSRIGYLSNSWASCFFCSLFWISYRQPINLYFMLLFFFYFQSGSQIFGL